jgi:hypothetical protein
MYDVNEHIVTNGSIIIERINKKVGDIYSKKQYSSENIKSFIERFISLFPIHNKYKSIINYKQFRGLVNENDNFYSLEMDLIHHDNNMIFIKRIENSISIEMFPNLSTYDCEYSYTKHSCKTVNISLDIIDNKFVRLNVSKILTDDEIQKIEQFCLIY